MRPTFSDLGHRIGAAHPRVHSRWMNLHPSMFLMLAVLSMHGCGGAIRPSFDSPEPAARNAAIVLAAGEPSGDKALPDLVRMLESDDPATRLLAIVTLERKAGTRLGYNYEAPPSRRAPAVMAWREWLEDNHPEPTAP